VSFADVVVLAGSAAIQKAAKDAGHDVAVSFAPGRTDVAQDETDVESFGWLETHADGFRSYLQAVEKQLAERRLLLLLLLLEKAYRLSLSAPEMTVLVGGAGAGRQPRRDRAWRLHRQAGDVDQRLLQEPARHEHGVEGVGVDGERL
jgi:catalase (peroxidase I)